MSGQGRGLSYSAKLDTTEALRKAKELKRELSELSRLSVGALQQRQLAAATRLARASQVAASGSYTEAQQRLRALGAEIRNTTGGFRNQTPAIQAKIREYNELNARLKAFDATMGNHQRNVGNYSSALGGVGAKLAGMAAGFLSAQALLTSAFDTALRTDAIKTSLEFTFNSIEIAAEKMDNLRATAKRLGLEYISLADTYRAFAGAAVASNFSIKETDRIFNAVANAGAKLKLSSDQVKGALTALQQMISKGKVSSEELTQQLGERLPGALSIASRSMGLTNQEMFKLMESGQLMASELLPKLATELDKTFKNDAAENVDSLQGSVNRLKNAFTEVVETKGAVGAFFEFVIDKAASTVNAIAVLSKSLGIFYELATDPKKFIKDSTKNPRAEANAVITGNANLSAAGISKTLGSKSEAVERIDQEIAWLKRLNAEYIESKKVYDKTRAGDRSLTDTKRFQELENSVRYQQAFVTGLKNEFSTLYPAVQKVSKELTSIAAIRAEINKLSKLDGSAVIGSDIYNQIEALKAKLKKPKDTTASDYKKAEREAEALGEKLTKLLSASSMASMTADEKEVESVKAKYAEMQKEADKFYKNPKNAGRRVVVNGQNFSRSQVNGSIKAMQKAEEDAITARDKAEAVKKEEDKLKALLEEFMSYADKRKAAQVKYEEDIARLANHPEAKATREEVRQAELQEDADVQAKKMDAYEALFNGIDKLSDENARTVIANAQKMLADLVSTGGISKKLADEISVMIGQSTDAIKSRLPDGLINLARQIDQVVDSVDGVNESFKKILSTVSNVVGQVGNIKKGMADFKLASGKNDVFSQLSAGLGIFGAGMSIMSSVNNFLDRQTQADKERADARAAELRSTNALTKALERQLEVAGKTYGTEKINEYRKAVADATKTIEESKKALSSKKALTLDDSELNELIEKVNNGEKLSNWSWWGMTDREKYRYASKNLQNVTTDVKELQKLLDAGRLDANTAKIAENYLNAIKSIEEAGNAIAEFVTGSTFDSLADNIVDMFRQGTTAAEDFAGNFEDIMKNAIMNSFKTKLLTDQLQAFYKEFATFSESGGVLTKTEIDLLKGQYDKIIKDGQEKFAELGKITGMDLSGKSKTDKGGLTGAIRREMTEATASELTGLYRAQYDISKKTNKAVIDVYAVARESLSVQVKIEQNTRRGADNTDNLDAKLDLIVANTKAQREQAGRAFGV